MSQAEALVSFLLITSLAVMGFGSYRALRFAPGWRKLWGVFAPVLYFFAWLGVPAIGDRVGHSHYIHEAPFTFATVVYAISFSLMIVASLIGALCIRFFHPFDAEGLGSGSPSSGAPGPRKGD